MSEPKIKVVNRTGASIRCGPGQLEPWTAREVPRRWYGAIASNAVVRAEKVATQIVRRDEPGIRGWCRKVGVSHEGPIDKCRKRLADHIGVELPDVDEASGEDTSIPAALVAWSKIEGIGDETARSIVDAIGQASVASLLDSDVTDLPGIGEALADDVYQTLEAYA